MNQNNFNQGYQYPNQQFPPQQYPNQYNTQQYSGQDYQYTGQQYQNQGYPNQQFSTPQHYPGQDYQYTGQQYQNQGYPNQQQYTPTQQNSNPQIPPQQIPTNQIKQKEVQSNPNTSSNNSSYSTSNPPKPVTMKQPTYTKTQQIPPVPSRNNNSSQPNNINKNIPPQNVKSNTTVNLQTSNNHHHSENPPNLIKSQSHGSIKPSSHNNNHHNQHNNHHQPTSSTRNLYRSTKKRGAVAKVGHGVISRMFYTIALVKKRLLEMELEGEIEAAVGVLGIVYAAEVEVEKHEDVEQQDLYLREIEQNGNFGDLDEKTEKEKDKEKEKANPGFIKKAVNKFLGGFKDHLILLAEKMDTHHLHGKVGIGLYLKFPYLCKIKLEPLISTQVLHEWYLKELELENKRFLGTLTIRLVSAKGILPKKNACAMSFKIGDVKYKSSFKGGGTDTILWDETIQPMPCSPKGDEITVKFFQKAMLGEELYDEFFLKVDKLGLQSGQKKDFKLPYETGHLEFEFYQQFNNTNLHGILKLDLIEGKDLPKKDITGKSDPYVVLAQGNIKETSINKILQNKNIFIAKSTWKNQTLNPVWNELLTLSIFNLKDGFTILCFDYDLSGEDDFMGSSYVSLDNLKPGTMSDIWVPMETGKIHVQYELILFEK